MFNILSKYDSQKAIFEKFCTTKEFRLSLFECQAKFPTYSLGTNDTIRATSEMYTSFEDWFFNLDESISDLEYTAFLDSYGLTFRNSIREFFLNINTNVQDTDTNVNNEITH